MKVAIVTENPVLWPREYIQREKSKSMLEPLNLLRARKGDRTQLHKHIDKWLQQCWWRSRHTQLTLVRFFVPKGPGLSSGD